MPDQGCDAACVKIIINGGFMAALAPKVAELWPNGAVGQAANELAEAAQLQREMFKARGLTVEHTDSFDGCDQAKAMVEWLTTGEHPKDAAVQMNEWSSAIWQQIADLAAGKHPSGS